MKISNQYLISTFQNLTNNSSNTTSLNYSLSLTQVMALQNTITQLRNYIDNFNSFLAINLNDSIAQIEYSGSNYAISFIGIDRSFNFSYFKSSSYESYFDMSSCLVNTMANNYNLVGYQLFIVFTKWKNSPFMYDSSLYFNNTSPMTSISILDPDTGKKIIISNCILTPILLYFPISNINMIDYINNKSPFLNPFNQYQYNDGIFTDPIYVTPNGTVVNTTIQSRIDTYYLNINISCNYYDSSINKYSNFGMIYTNYSNGYISCGSTHLTDFVLTQNYQPPNFTVSGPYFYLKYISLVVNSVNLNYKIV